MRNPTVIPRAMSSRFAGLLRAGLLPTGALFAGLLLAGCAAWPPAISQDAAEVHRGLDAGRKSSPDSGQSPAGDGLGGWSGPGR